MEQWLFLIVIAALSGFIQGLTGFGCGIVLMFFMPMMFGYQVSVGINIICALIMSIFVLGKMWRDVEIKKILPFLIPGLIIQAISTHYLFEFNDNTLDIIFAVILLAFAGLFVLSAVKCQMKASVPGGIFMGIVSGLCNILGIGGPPLGYYCHSVFKDNKKYMANLQATMVISVIFMLVQHCIKGNITFEVLKYSVVSGIVCLLVLTVALKIFQKLNRSKMTVLIIIFLTVMGIVKLIF